MLAQMRILFFSPRQCLPIVSGARLREYHLARMLGENAELTYVYFADPGAAPPLDLPFCCRIIRVDRPKLYTPSKILRGVVGRFPLNLINYYSVEMAAALQHVTRGTEFDLIHADSLHMTPYLWVLPESLRRRVIFDWHNIDSEVLFRYAGATRSLPRKLYAIFTARRLRTVEKQILRSAFGHIVCSEREREALLGGVPEARIAVVENGVDSQKFGEPAPFPRNRILFVGSMTYHANSDAIIWFTDRVWPALHERFPEWKLTLVGSDPPARVRALAQRAGVEVTGTVPDVKPYYDQAVLAIVPLFTGGGTRLKVLEAFAAGVPVVSTPLGVEGLTVTPGGNVLIVNNESDWLSACSLLSSQGDEWRKLVRGGRQLAENRYDWDILGKSMVDSYRQWLSADKS